MEHTVLTNIVDYINDKLGIYEWDLMLYGVHNATVKFDLSTINGFIDGVKIGFDVDITIKYNTDGTIVDYLISKDGETLYYFQNKKEL